MKTKQKPKRFVCMVWFVALTKCNALRVHDVASKLNVAQCQTLAFGRYSTMRVKRTSLVSHCNEIGALRAQLKLMSSYFSSFVCGFCAIRFDINLKKSATTHGLSVCEWMTYRFIAFRYSPEMMMNTRTYRKVTAARQPNVQRPNE